jgi:hypothetical protein
MTARHETCISDHCVSFRLIVADWWTGAALKVPSIRAHFISFSMKFPPSKIETLQGKNIRIFPFKSKKMDSAAEASIRPLGPIPALPACRQSVRECHVL